MEEREQKTLPNGYLQERKLETRNLMGVQTCMDISERGLVEVEIDDKHSLDSGTVSTMLILPLRKHLLETILSNNNLNNPRKGLFVVLLFEKLTQHCKIRI